MKLPFKVMYFGNCTLEKWRELPCAGFTFSQVSPVQTRGFLRISDSSFSQWRTPGVTAAASMIYPVCPLSTHRLNGERQRWLWRCACTTLVYEELRTLINAGEWAFPGSSTQRCAQSGSQVNQTHKPQLLAANFQSMSTEVWALLSYAVTIVFTSIYWPLQFMSQGENVLLREM